MNPTSTIATHVDFDMELLEPIEAPRFEAEGAAFVAMVVIGCVIAAC
jgi:hypothetical protein